MLTPFVQSNSLQKEATVTTDASEKAIGRVPPKLRHLVLAKAHETHSGKNATEASVRMTARLAGITQDIQNFVRKNKNCQMNWPSLEKTVFEWPEAQVWERLHVDWVYVKDQGNVFVIVDAGF